MEFHKPVVLPSDISEIMQAYDLGEVDACKYLGGIPNTSYMVITDQLPITLRIYGVGQSSLDHIQLEHAVLRYLAETDFPCPRLVTGKNGQTLQRWQGYWVCASEFIPGVMADSVELTPRLVRDVGRLVALFERSMVSFPSTHSIPDRETFIGKGVGVLESLDSALARRGWQMDVSGVFPRWEKATQVFRNYQAELGCNVIHADIWPPNVVCDGERVVGLIDFDDCCYGPTILDIALALMEFSMYQDTKMNPMLAQPLLMGYLENGGRISEVERDLMISAMEMACCVWLAYNVLEAPTYEEANIYRQRLDALTGNVNRDFIQACISGSLYMAS